MFPSADILSYYEDNARYCTDNRAFIIEKGFHAWLLSVSDSSTKEISAYKSTVPEGNTVVRNACPENEAQTGSFRAYPPNTQTSDFVILAANLIGGGLK